jgi:Fe2+ transport system protein FeoA
MPTTSSANGTTVRLSQLPAGSTAEFRTADLADDDSALLRALGLTERCRLRVCKAGEPCIVQVRATRIGLSREVAAGILVVPDAAA